MKTLHISVVDKIATYQKRDGDIVCGNSDYQIKFTFDEEWGSHTKKTARFIWNNQYFDVDFTGDTCAVPIVQKTEELQVGVFAGDLVTTTPAKIGCKTSILCGSGMPSVANDKHYANEAKEAAESAASSASTAAKKATDAAEAEVTRLVGELGISQTLGDSVTATVSQKVITDNFNKSNKRLTNLEKGIIPDPFETDDSVAYAKIVPEGALPYAEVSKVGGMTYRDEETNTLKSTVVTKIIATGKNLFKVDTIYGNETNNGLTLRKVDGGGVSVSGTASALAQRMLYKINTNRLPNGYYFLSGKTNNIDVYAECRKNGNFVKAIFADSKIYVDNSQFDTLDICIQIKAGVTLNETVYPMLNYGDFFVTHEPYKESVIEIPQEVQNLNGYGLGISSDYCNHIDFNLDKYRQTVKKYVCQGGSNLSIGFISESKGNPYRCFIISEPLYGRMYGTPYVVSAPFTKGSQSAVFEGVSGSYHIAPFDRDAMAETSFYVSFSCEDLGVPENAAETALKNAAKALLKNLYDQGTPLTVVYALRTPIGTDIADTLTDDNFIEVSEGGLVIAENADGLGVPTTITYQIKEDAE